MENEVIPILESIELKALGFDMRVCGYYYLNEKPTPKVRGISWVDMNSNGSSINPDSHVSAPLLQQVFRWFEEVHGYYVEPFVDDDKTFGYLISYFLDYDDPIIEEYGGNGARADLPIRRLFPTSKERDLACLRHLIEMVKNKVGK